MHAHTRTLRTLLAPIALFALTAAATAITSPARADGDPTTDDVPRMLPYQGVLERDGVPVEAAGENALHLLFALYDGAGAEAPIYTQALVVEVFTGRFTATIGPVGLGPDGQERPIDALFAAADDLYLGMTLLGDPDDPEDDVPLANRQRIYATPYAMWSTSATNLSVAGHARVGGDLAVTGAARVDGGLRVAGPVELPAGSLGLDALDPATVGEGLVRDGAGVTIDQGWLDDRIRTWVRSHCTVRLGWRDSCTNCGSGPSKQVTVRADGTCIDARGSDTRCRGNNAWGGVNTDGDVNNDDVFYIHMNCN